MKTTEKTFWEYGDKRRTTRKARAFEVWLDKLFLIATRIFKYSNLPANLPSWEIEKRLIMAGNCFVFKNRVYGVVTSFGGLSGVDIYNNANSFNYAQSVLGSKSGLRDLKDGVIVYGTSLDKIYGSRGVIGKRLQWYADQLSDIDVSRQVGLINNRSMCTVIAKSDNALNELRTYYQKLQDGEFVTPKIFSGVLESTENLIKSATVQGYTLNDFDVAQQNLIKAFYRDFGISYATEKKERLITDEVAADDDALDINIADMLECRQTGINSINNLFGTTITVEVNNDVIT